MAAIPIVLQASPAETEQGVNRLVVRVRESRSVERFDSLVFSLTAKAPIAQAGQDQRHKVGQTVRLDGGSSLTSGAPGAVELTFRWELTSRPEGSHAALQGASTPSPTFVPDLRGTYVATLVVNDGGFDAVPDTVTVKGTAATILVAVDTFHRSSDQTQYGILVGDTLYGAAAQLDGTGVQILVLDRVSLGDPVFKAYQGGSNPAADISAYLTALDNTKIVLISSGEAGTGFAVSGIAKTLEAFGATTEFRTFNSGSFTFSFIGVKGLKPGQAYQVGAGPSDPPASLAGSFTTDSWMNYAFFRPDYLAFDFRPAEDVNPYRILIGSVGIDPPVTQFVNGGFWVLCLDRADVLGTAKNNTCVNKYFSTNDTDPTKAVQEQVAMTDALSTLAGNENALVFIRSLGQPLSSQEATSRQIAEQIARFGGTQELFTSLGPSDTYLFLGASSPPAGSGLARFWAEEASSQMSPHPSSRLRGILGRGRRGNWYSPILVDQSDVGNLDLLPIVAQAAVAWPVPVTPAETAAFAYISNQVCSSLGVPCPDLRVGYNNSNTTAPLWYDIIQGLKFSDVPIPPAFDSATFDRVQTQLKTEVGYLAEVQTLSANLNELYGESASWFAINLGKVAKEVKASIETGGTDKALLVFEDVVNFMLRVAAIVPGAGPPLAAVVGGTFGLGTSLANLKDGNSSSAVDATVDSLESDGETHFTQQQAVLGTLFDIILEDWGRLQALGPVVNNPNIAEWFWDGTKTTSYLHNLLMVYMKRSLYQSIMPAKYRTGVQVNSKFPSPSDLCTRTLTCFFGLAPVWAWQAILQPTDGFTLETIYSGNANFCAAEYPKQAFMSGLTSAVDESGNNLGVYRPYIFERWLPQINYHTFEPNCPNNMPLRAVPGAATSSGGNLPYAADRTE